MALKYYRSILLLQKLNYEHKNIATETRTPSKSATRANLMLLISNMKNVSRGPLSGQSDYPRIPQDTPGHPKTLQNSIICMFNILYERVDDGLVLVCWCIN